MNELDIFLAKKPLFYDKIDYDRFPSIWQKYKGAFLLPKIIHIVGTNAKGSTGRFLAHYLYKQGVSVGHYSSPHILNFNERIWQNGKNVDNDILNEHHIRLQLILEKKDSDALSYFEYSTLLAVSVLQKSDFIILEAGLGGEYDATSVFENDLSIVTPIGMDHQNFLGDTIEKIAKTKLKAVRKFAILAKQERIVYKMAKEMSRKKDIEFFRYGYFFTKDEIAKAKRAVRSLSLPEFFSDNLLVAMAGAKFFGFEIKFRALEDVKLFGRAQKIAPNITIDVGHNPLAACALFKSYKNKKIVLVYNSFNDKDYVKILEILKPIVKRVEILPIYNQRMEKIDMIKKALLSLNIKYCDFKECNENEEYLVFGSFVVVEEFLKYHAPKAKN